VSLWADVWRGGTSVHCYSALLLHQDFSIFLVSEGRGILNSFDYYRGTPTLFGGPLAVGIVSSCAGSRGLFRVFPYTTQSGWKLRSFNIIRCPLLTPSYDSPALSKNKVDFFPVPLRLALICLLHSISRSSTFYSDDPSVPTHHDRIRDPSLYPLFLPSPPLPNHPRAVVDGG